MMQRPGHPLEETDAMLRAAIEQKRLLELNYLGKLRVVEPHDYGECR